ncbi:hydrogenase expression/formation protein HypE [candidate division WOR-3 bacterium JGI_Cruoil_03_51_56]|uniref:Hydrogenase expression/formation protein HypE n=1 Tax=candidate division WOR-3 bacterium JGI_Cruoil_03_51_56 TaxID=1973747 RepID=A0A235BRI2_UNCW3|nr:MAG: hydrogenase expression/formation protein HypE [candidate division WOR-3 bacterium JGI_Cruoil_03_51_56]
MTKYEKRFVVGDIVDERIVMGHGAGGRKMHRLINKVFLKHFENPTLSKLEDAAVFRVNGRSLAMSTDSYVIQPLFFPGGDIGKLAVCGTVNDLAVMGANPGQISVGLIIREGVEMAVLERVCRSMGRTARKAGVEIVTGDTKVIERGTDEGLYINTTGVGNVSARLKLGPEQVKPGDILLINGGIGEHEAAIAIARGSFRFKANLESDCAPLHTLIRKLLLAGGIRMMRDPTRGGLATTLNEFATATGLGFIINEESVPISDGVMGVAELLGLDPLYMANEGKVVVVAAEKHCDRLVKTMHQDPHGRKGRRIGEVVDEPKGVWLRTRLGSLRPLIMLEGEQLPRIC